MSMVLVLVLATGAAPAPAGNVNAANGAQVSPAVDPTSRSPEELRGAVTGALRRASTFKRADRPAAIKSLALVYNELGRDVRLSSPERIRLGSLVRGRLTKFSVQMKNELARGAQQQSGQQATSAKTAAENLDDLVDLIQTTIGRPDDWILAQRAGNGGAGGVAGAGPGGAGVGGPGGNGGAAGGTNSAADANGEDLVDLIQRTVVPPSWDVNGGPGTIKYYRNMRALVVRQSGDVHDELGDLVDQLRR